MNVEETLKQFKKIAPDAAYSEKSKRIVLATLPRERWTIRRGLLHIFETGIAVALAVFFIFVVTGQIANTPYVKNVEPVQFSVINPETLKAEAQAVDMQIQLAEVAYAVPTSTPNESTAQTATGTTSATQSGFAAAVLRAVGANGANTSSSSTTGVAGSSTATSSAVVSVDQALNALSR